MCGDEEALLEGWSVFQVHACILRRGRANTWLVIAAGAALLVGCERRPSVDVVSPPRGVDAAAAALGQPPPSAPPREGCLPDELHGPFVEGRGAWRLYLPPDPASPRVLRVLEHLGPRVVTDEDEVVALREEISSDFMLTDPGRQIVSFGVGSCGEDLPVPLSRAACFAVGIRDGVDPFVITQRLDAFLGASHEGSCFGVTIEVGEEAVAW